MRKFTSLLLIAVSTILDINLSLAQTPGIVGTNAFFAGQWLEIGEQSNGDFGARTAPAGYHTHCETCDYATALAEVYDFGHDGWTVGTPAFMGDYTYPGSPFEGWEIQYGAAGTARAQAFCTGGVSGSFTNVGGAVLTGSLTSFTDIGGRQIATWTGTLAGAVGTLQINQQTEVDTFASWVIINVKLRNAGASAIDSIYYMRTTDPDNNEQWAGGSFASENYIDYQNDVEHRVQARASSTTPAPGDQYPMALCAKDSRAVALVYNVWPMSSTQNLAAVWDKTYGTGAAFYAIGSEETGDIAIGIVFKIGSIAAGDSAMFSYAYTFNGISGVDSAFPSNDSAGYITGVAALCIGYTTTLSDDTTGGVWSSSATSIATVGSTGVVTGMAAGSATISYTVGTSSATLVVVVSASPVISSAPLCMGGTDTFTALPSGGTWSSTAATITIGSSSGIVTPLSTGTALISYIVGTGCTAAVTVTVDAALSAISGPSGLCEASTITLSDPTAGGTWSSSIIGTAPVGSATGIVGGIAPGTSTITYSLSAACASTMEVTVYPLPLLAVGESDACGGTDTMFATVSGGGTCTWSPSTGLSCTACDTTIASIAATSTYTVSSTSSFACTVTDTITLDGNRISGFISMTTTPTDTLKVWLIQFNAIDSSLTAEDSAFTCMDGSIPYYEFDDEPAGDYMVKAKLLSSVAGTSGYVPTYGLSTIHWDTAATIVHASATDTQHINMIYGIVPSGPGFIGGLISAGAGRGTSAPIPIVGLMVYLEDVSGNILSYTYTNSSGLYSFSGLDEGTYTIYPVNYHFRTIPWSGILIGDGTDTFTNINFYEFNTMQLISPDSTLSTTQLTAATNTISIFPNPTTSQLTILMSQSAYTSFTITNSIGQDMIQQPLTNTQTQVNVATLPPGMYYITFRGDNGTTVQKFVKM